MPGSRDAAGLGFVLAAVIVTLGLGYLVKAPCASGEWGDLRQYRRLCYTDIVPLYGTERLDEGKVPYFEADNEYPVLTGAAMWAAAQPADSFASFFHANAAILGAAALLVAAALWRAVGARALYFAAAPTLLIYGFINWDLIAVALATGATVLYLRSGDAGSGALLGLGAAAKLYPGLLLAPFAAGRARARRPGGVLGLVAAAALAWAVVNVPVALAEPDRWSKFFRFNTDRPADWDTAWFLLGRHGVRLTTATVNLWSAVAFVAAALLIWAAKRRREPGFPAWSFGFPLLVAFLLTNKVYSPQYGLWLLPWFALVLPDLRLFAAFEATEIAVFVTRFRFFGDPHGLEGAWFDGFEASLIVRAVVLLVAVGAWVARPADRTAERRLGTPAAEAA